jgi:hypothetical protein
MADKKGQGGGEFLSPEIRASSEMFPDRNPFSSYFLAILHPFSPRDEDFRI